MAISAGSVYSEMILDISKYEASIQKADQHMANFMQRVQESSKKMDLAIDSVDKRYKLWELSSNDITKALQSKGKQVDSIKEKMNLLEKEITNTNSELSKAIKAYGSASDEAKTLENELLDLQVRHAELNKELEQFSFGNRLKEAGKHMEEFGQKLTTRVSLPLVGLGTAASKVSMDFEAQMSRVSAIAGAIGDDLERLKDQAMDLGAKTAFSAKGAAEGMENLASAGFSVTEIMEAMPGMLDLAAAGGVEIADASEIASSALRGFGLAASEAGHVADVLARAASDTNAGILDMGYAMKYAAPVASAMGWSIEAVATAIGLMSDAGIKGEQAGTTLRGAITRLVNPSDAAAKAMQNLGFNAFDAEGKMLSLSEIIRKLQKGTAGLTDEQRQQAIATIFGQEAMSGMLALMSRGPEEIERLIESFRNSNGAADEMARTMQDNLKGAVEELGGSLETAGIVIGDILAPMIREAAETVSELVNKFSNLNPETQDSIVKIGMWAAAIGPGIVLGGKLAQGLGGIINLFSMLTPATAAATAATGAATVATGGFAATATAALAPLASFILGLGAVTAAGYGIYKTLNEEAIPSVDLFADKVEYAATNVSGNAIRMGYVYKTSVTEISEATKEAVGAYVELDDQANKHLNSLYINSTEITEAIKTETIANYQELFSSLQAGYENQKNEIISTLQDFFSESQGITDQEQAELLSKAKEFYAQKKATAESYEQQIVDIMARASEEKRSLTAEEVKTINELQQQMKEEAVKVLSENELEAKIILERMKEYDARMTAEQASEHIKQLNESKDKAIATANEEYEKRIALIIQMRDEAKVISAEQADVLIREAQRQRDGIIEKAEETKTQAISKMKEMNSELENQVDISTGRILTTWDKLKKWWNNLVNDSQPYYSAQNATGMFEKGIKDGQPAIEAASKELGSGIASYLAFHSPTEKGPLSESDRWMPNMVQMLADGIRQNSEKVKNAADELANKVNISLAKVNEYVANTVGIIEKEFQLWALQNSVVKDNSEYLSQQLEVQKEKHQILNEQIKATEDALHRIIEKYGEGSSQALEYKNKLLDLKVAQAELKTEIDNATKSIRDQVSAIDRLLASSNKADVMYAAAYKNIEAGGSGSSNYRESLETAKNNPNYQKNLDALIKAGMGPIEAAERLRQKYAGRNAQGTNFWRGGLTWVGELGPELVELPRGSKIYNNKESERIAAKQGGITQNIHIHSPEPLSPSETARKHLQVSRQLAMEWGL